jgi:hypothetical protein
MEAFRASREAKGKTVEIVGRQRASYTGGTTRYGLGPSTVGLWARLAAKVALGAISLLGVDKAWLDTAGAISLLGVDEAWLDTAGANSLRALFLHDAQPPYPIGVFPSELDEEHPLTGMLRPPEHLSLATAPAGGRLDARHGALWRPPVPDRHKRSHLPARSPHMAYAARAAAAATRGVLRRDWPPARTPASLRFKQPVERATATVSLGIPND